jgi:hypothetical protein
MAAVVVCRSAGLQACREVQEKRSACVLQEHVKVTPDAFIELILNLGTPYRLKVAKIFLRQEA